MQLMSQLRGSDYGFECDFIVSGDTETISVKYSERSDQIHEIEYSIQVIKQMISRKT